MAPALNRDYKAELAPLPAPADNNKAKLCSLFCAGGENAGTLQLLLLPLLFSPFSIKPLGFSTSFPQQGLLFKACKEDPPLLRLLLLPLVGFSSCT